MALVLIGWHLSLKEKVSGMLDIIQITDKRDIPSLGPIIKEYTEELGKEDEYDSLLISIFTRFEKPGTLLLAAVKDEEPVGFFWAQSVSKFGEKYLIVLDIYSKKGLLGIKLFEWGLEWAKERGIITVKGLVSPERAKGMKRLFGMKEEAIFISMEVE